MGEYNQVMKEQSGQSESGDKSSHEETNPAAMKRDWKQEEDMTSHVLHNITDSLDTDLHPDVLINISTGIHATPTIQQS